MWVYCVAPLLYLKALFNGEVENSKFSEYLETSENQCSEFSILHYTQNGNLGDENLGVLFQAFLPNSEFSILHYTQNGKLGVGNVGVFSEVYQNSDFLKLLNQTLRFSNSEFSILHHTQNGKLRDGKLRDGKPRSLIRRHWRKLRSFHLRVFHFEFGAKWKSQSWKTSEFDQSTSEFDETASEQISKVFSFGIVENGKLGVESLRKLILQGF